MAAIALGQSAFSNNSEQCLYIFKAESRRLRCARHSSWPHCLLRVLRQESRRDRTSRPRLTGRQDERPDAWRQSGRTQAGSGGVPQSCKGQTSQPRLGRHIQE